MAFRYLIYSTGTTYSETIIRESETDNAGINEASLYSDFVIPVIQPLYLWKVSGGTTVVPNTDNEISNYLETIAPTPQPEDNASIGFVTGITSQKIDVVTGATGNIGTFVVDGSLQDSGYSIAELTGATSNTFIGSGSTVVTESGDTVIIYSPTGDTTAVWGNISGVLSNQTDLQNALDAKLQTIDFNTYTGNTKPVIDSALTGITNLGTGSTLGGADSRNITFKSISSVGDISLIGDANNLIISGGTNTVWGDISGVLSNQTDLQNVLDNKLPTNDFNTYTGITDSRITDVENDIIYISGVTDTKLQISDFNDYTGTTDTRITDVEDDITELYNESLVNITGATNGLRKIGDKDVELGGLLTKNTVISGLTYDFSVNTNNIALESLGQIDIIDTGSNGINIKSDEGVIKIAGNDAVSTPVTKIEVGENTLLITDNRTTPYGIQYAGDYSSTFQNRSLIDKAYVDAVATGLVPKANVQAVTTSSDGNIDLTGATFTGSIDGYTLVGGDRVLITEQTLGSENGIYVYNQSTNDFTRSVDFNGDPDSEVSDGNLIPVLNGDAYSNTLWVLITPNPIIIGTTLLNFTLFSNPVDLKAGVGIGITGQTIAVNGSVLAGNSIVWNDNKFDVDTTIGTLNTALNSKLNTTIFTNYTGVTAPNTYLKLDQSTPQNISGGTPQFDSLRFNTNSGITHVHNAGDLHWNSDDGTLEVDMTASGVKLQVGQEILVKVINKTGSLIPNGKVVYPIGGESGYPLIELAEAAATVKQFGITTEDIPDGEFGYASTFGKIRNINTSGYTEGTFIYLSTVPGEFTDTKPPAPYKVISLGFVVTEDPINGVIMLDYKGADTLEELSNVERSGAFTTGDFPVWNGTFYDLTTNINDYVLKSTYSGFTGNTNLQTVTEIGSTTDVETSFSSGIITNRIKPSADTVTAVQISKNDNTPIINIDTISGFTGYGTITPEAQIHTYGTDTCDDSSFSLQTNGIKIDGIAGADKNIQWAENGVTKWLAHTHRNENGRFWYLHNHEGQNSPFVSSESGRIGINNPSNFINKYALFNSTSGLNDIRFAGMYENNFVSVFQIEIDGTGTPDTFRWRVSYDEGNTYGSWISGVTVSTGQTLLENGVYVYFLSETGHTLGNSWEKPVFPQLPSGVFSLHPNKFEEVLLTDNYGAATVDYRIYTAEFNSSREIEGIPILTSGDTSGAFYVASTTKIESVYFNINEGGENITLITEYWNGSFWTDISLGTGNYFDDTHDLTTTGIIQWDSSNLSGWIKADIVDFEADNEYYWLRFRSVTNVTKQPLLNNIAANGSKRLDIYSSPYDYKPAMYVNTLGNINIGGGTITRKNKLQINDRNYLDVSVGSGSLVEMDSSDPQAADLRVKLVSEDTCGTGIAIVKTRGDLNNTTTVLNGDELGHIWFRAKVGTTPTTGATLNSITSIYTGNGTYESLKGDLLFNTANGGFPLERVRINASGNTGFGIGTPTAVVHLQSGTTSTAAFKFTSGQLLTTPEEGAIEFDGNQWYGTISGDSRKTFAFLESPEFTGSVSLPSTTILNEVNLIDYINFSGGSENELLIKTTDFNTYTGNTENRITGIESDITYISGVTDTKLDTSIFNTYTGESTSWSDIDFSGSDLADLETSNAVDVNYSEPNWNISNVEDGLNKLTGYIENIGITGRIEPINVLFGKQTNTLSVSGGTGYINYEGFHEKISWSAQTFFISGGTTEGTYYVYVDSTGDVNISPSQPNVFENILLGTYYFGGYIGVIQQSGILTTSSSNRIVNSLLRQGIFIYNNGGLVQLLSGSTVKIISSPCKVQYGLTPSDLVELSSNDASTYHFLHYYNSADYQWALNYHFSVMNEGKIYTNRWNDITKNSYEVLSGYSLTFTQYSTIVTSPSDLTSLDLENSFIYLSGDTDTYATPVSGVTWDGSGTTITLETMYVGTGTTGTTIANYTLPKLAPDKFAKHLIIRSTDGNMFLVLGQITYSSIDDARNGVLPAMPTGLVDYAIKMAYIVNVGEETDLTGNIYDIRPLPYQYREGGQSGGGVAITNHGDLSGLSNDDHLQYLKTNGSRNITGIQRYQSQPTFTTDLDIITKKYVDDGLGLKTDSTTFNTFTGTTLPDNYYNETEIDSYSASTLTNINSRLLISDFDTYTGVTAPQTYLNQTGGTITSDLMVQGDIYLTGTTPTTEELKDSHLLGAITSDGRIIKTNSSTMSITQNVQDIAISTGITELYGIYYVDATAGDITLIIPDATSTNDGSRFSIIKKTGNNDVIITTVGGTQNIGNQTSQTISQTDKGLTIVSDNDNDKWLVVQDSRFLEGSTDGELQYWDTDVGKWKVSGTDLLWDDVNKTLNVSGNICGNSLNITGNSTIGGIATFIGAPTAPTASVNTSTTQIATTEFVLNQAANTSPLMDGIAAIGTSLRYARQDHVHPTDTSRFAVTGGTITGSVNITNNLGVSGITTLSATTIGSGLAKYDADYSGSYDNRTLVDKEYVDTHPLAVQSIANSGTVTTTSTTDTLMTGMQFTGVVAGSYLLSFGTSIYNITNNTFIYTTIYVNGTAINSSLQTWKRGNQDIQSTHNYANFPITIADTSTIEIRWRTSAGTASSSNRHLTLLKTDTLT